MTLNTVSCGRILLTLGLICLITISCSTHRSKTESVPDRNVLLIIVDDLNTTLGTYGHTMVKTPNIDRLAQMGMQFENAYCNYALCGPSRSSFLTGILPQNLGILDNRTQLQSVLGDKITLPHLFKKNGFETIGIGKIFHNLTPDHEDPKAWDAYYTFQPTELGKQGEFRNLTNDQLAWCEWGATEGTDDDRPDGMHAAKAVELIKQERDKPFFLAVGFHKPHDPFVAPKKYFDLYPLEECTPTRPPDGWEPAYPFSFSKWHGIFSEFSEQEMREFTRAYYACTSFMDAQVGRLLDALEESGQLDNTLIVFFGDHGYHLGEHGWWNKGTLYEKATKAPFIMAGSSISRKGTKSEAFFEFIDIYPTLADLMNLNNIPDYLEGKSFSELLSDPSTVHREHVAAVVQKGQVYGKMIKTKKWRYISWEGEENADELYDQENDPIEYNNIAELPRYSSTLEKMRILLATKFAKTSE